MVILLPSEKLPEKFSEGRLPDGDRELALFHLIELGALARKDVDSLPLLPAKYHLFARPPQGIWVCLNPECSGRQHDHQNGWSRVFANRREKCDSCGKSVYPLYVCRTCGQRYIRGMKEGGFIRPEADPIWTQNLSIFLGDQSRKICSSGGY